MKTSEGRGLELSGKQLYELFLAMKADPKKHTLALGEWVSLHSDC